MQLDQTTRYQNEGLTEQQATRSLTALWNFNNNAEKVHLEEAPQRLQDLKDEEEATRLEDRKKNKNKRLKAGDYCELHYFTNKGLNEAKVTTLIAEPDALVMLPAADGVHSWVPAAAVKDPKAAPVTKDENLTWEEFNEAAPRIISFMKVHDWPDDRVSMHIQFWTALQAHRWRHAPDVLKQKALLLYQSQQ
ncbi:uncharacterized protein F5891DRAFT_1166135 [Suillus fuscotomentosus]|uniref:Uncharacterized protein n=1 Tax=Suillus fuscotomentosus TaxID=1912939 RepID=A0AAD4HFG4_9AGAM|nr:uncharacterized protein F5891DRAFT_1166135 [Suillus fuscotomentosus]KAG1894567.1 hypothetical protein F5891DRAFT_1166135 [Suillus fuscotomentosus]